MTQRQLAGLSTVSIRAIRDLELGRAQVPRRETVRLIADGLGLTGRARTQFEESAGRRASVVDLKRIYDARPAPPPAPLDGLVGRAAEVGVLRGMLTEGNQRLVTITGLAAVGKTRLALEVAGILHATTATPVLWTSSADATVPSGGAPRGDRPSPMTRVLGELFTSSDVETGELTALIGDRAALLVLDGHDAAQIRVDRVIPLLQECRGLQLLITSRVPFHIRGEWTLPLPPLPVPTDQAEHDPGDLATVASVQLLLRHVRRVRPEFELSVANARAVAALCRSLDGIPAALEAVASWFLLYEAEVLLRYVRADPFTFIGGSATGDQLVDLRDLLRRTVDSLDAAERSLLAQLVEVRTAWSMSDVSELTGVPATVCAALVRRLLLRGLVRPVGDADRPAFVALELVRLLHADAGVGSALTGVRQDGDRAAEGRAYQHWLPRFGAVA